MAIAPAPRARREYWSLLLIPLALLLLDSYGGLAPGPSVIPASAPRTVLSPYQAQRLMPVLPDRVTQISPQERKAHLENAQGDLHPVTVISPSAATDPVQYELPPLPPGHYHLHTTHQGESVWQQPVHIATLPGIILDRPYKQAGASVSLWRSHSQNTQPYRIIHSQQGIQAEGVLSAQNPSRLDLPPTLPGGTYRVEVTGSGSQALHIFDSQLPLQVQVHDNRLLPGIEQSIDLHVLDDHQQPLAQGWVRLANHSYTVHNGQVKIPLKAEQVQAEIPFTAGVAEGQVVQGTLHFVLSTAPWSIRSLPPSQAKSPLLQWQGHTTGPLRWQAQQGHLQLHGEIPATPQALHHIQAQIQQGFQADIPVQLTFTDKRGFGQTLMLQWPNTPVQLSEVSPQKPHALSTLSIQHSEAHPYLSHYSLPQHWQLAPLKAQTLTHITSEPSFSWAFLWLLGGLGVSTIPFYRAYTRKRPLLPSAPVTQAIKQASPALYVGSSLWLLSLPALWLGLDRWGWQAYLGGLAINAFALAWPFRHRRLPTHPIWVFTQTALLLLCAWFCLTYAPPLFGALVLWSGLLHLGWLLRFKHWQRQTRTPSAAQIVLASLLGIGSLLHAWIALQSPTQGPGPNSLQETMGTTYLPVQVHDLQHSGSVPTQFSLQGQGGTHRVSSLTPQGHWDSQELAVRYTPHLTLNTPDIAHQNDQLELAVKVQNPTQRAVVVPLRFTSNQGTLRRQVTLKPGEQNLVHFPIRFSRSGLQTYTLAQYHEQQWHEQSWQTYVHNADPFTPPAETVRFSPLRMQVSYPETSLMVNGEIPVIVDVQHRLPEDGALSITLGIPTGFTPLLDTLQEEKHKSWLADLRTSGSAIHLDTQVLRAGQRVRFHYRLRADFAGHFLTPAATVKNVGTPALEEKASPTRITVTRQNTPSVLE